MSDRHPERGRLQAFLDDELPAGERRAVETHLERCERCHRRADRHGEWSRAFAETARLVDVPEPEMELPEPAAGAEEGGSRGRTGSAADVVRLGSFRRSSLLRAAAVVLALGAGALAVTSTPLRAFAGDLIDRIAGLFGGADGAPTAERVASDTASGPSVAPASAASIQARDGSVVVEIRTEAGAAAPVVRLRFRPMITATVEAPGASFETSPGRLVVNASRADTLLVELPEAVPNASVRVNGRTLIRKRGGHVTHGLSPDTAHGDLLYRPGR